METTNKKVLRLSFASVDGQTVSFTLPNPKAGLTKVEIEQVMDLVITKDIFLSKYGPLVSKKDIKIISTMTEDLYDPPVA